MKKRDPRTPDTNPITIGLSILALVLAYALLNVVTAYGGVCAGVFALLFIFGIVPGIVNLINDENNKNKNK